MNKQSNPFLNFDVTKVFADFEPAKMAEEFSKITGQYKLPAFDSVFNLDTMMASQRKNIEALTAANKAAVEGIQQVAARQAEMLQESLDEATKVVAELSKSGDPRELAGKQIDLYSESLEKALLNMRQLADMITDSSAETGRLVKQRFDESLNEIKLAAKAEAEPEAKTEAKTTARQMVKKADK